LLNMSNPSKNLEFDPDGGELRLGNLRYMLLRPETLSEIQKGVEDRLGPKSSEYLYAAGASWAVGALNRLKSALEEAPEDLAAALCGQATKLGWGHWELAGFEPEKKTLAVRVTGSPFAAAYGQSDEPVCHLAAGAVGGCAESLFRMPTACSELACRAQGDPHCLFAATGHDVAGADSWGW
jgi:predicted hydrocarbon binding protein